MRQGAKAALLLGLGLLWLGTTSCTSNEPETLGVEVSFDALPRAMQPIRVEVYMVESCDAVSLGDRPEDPVASTYALRDGGEGPRLGTLDPGQYGLYAIAQDASCVAVAAGCVPVTIDSNTEGPLSIALGGFSGEGCAVGEQCVVESGQCVPRTEDCSSQPDETPCVAGAENGLCRMGECCTGCWDGGTCHAGDEEDRCGLGGAFCKLCECFSDVCVEGACRPTPAFSSVDVGFEHTCAIADDGHLWCWGSDAQGELGLGGAEVPNCDAAGCNLPTELTTLVEGSVPIWSQASAGDGVTCAIRATDSSLWCWGSNESGRMGAPSDITGADEPFLVSQAVHGHVDNEGLTGCAIRAADGSLWCWGANNRGQAGQGTTGSDVYGPSKVPYGSAWNEVSVGNEFVFAIAEEQFWAWGNNTKGQIGTGATGNTVHPAATGFVGSTVEAGGETTCALDSAGVGYCWGENTNGQVGNGDSSGMDAGEPALVSGGHSFDHFGLGDDFACAVTTSGALYCWGRNRSGQLGVGQSFNALSQAAEPMRLGTDFDWVQVSAGGQSACALREDGSLWCWGRNDRGQLGLGDTDSRMVPTRLCF
jgi:alpha-tubulin suppressor-like RCC1 family protein